MRKYKKEVDITYFKKDKKVQIDEISVGQLIYLKIESPLNYGVSDWYFYGKLVKVTKQYFEILIYCDAYRINDWHTQQIEMKEQSPEKYTKKWAKKRIKEIYTIKTERKVEVREYETNT